eukprot:3659033-Amphidinium_carterae.1
MQRWDSISDIPLHKRGAKVLSRMDWDLQAKLEHISEEELQSRDYLDRILSVLDGLAGERAEDGLRRALQGALFSWKRERSESLAQFALRREQ